MKKYLLIASISGAMAVMMGALGAHKLASIIDSYSLQVFNKAVFYQFIHTLLLMVIVMFNSSSRFLFYSARFIVAGIVLFSGSLYLLSLKSFLNSSIISILGPLTPVGGVCFILSWLTISLYCVKEYKNTKGTL
jgi:uncharacterized membrane protein YgdD (TMEM256/DUF423 family)